MSKGKVAKRTISYILSGISLLLFGFYMYCYCGIIKIEMNPGEDVQALGSAIGMVLLFVIIICIGVAELVTTIPALILATSCVKSTTIGPKKGIDVAVIVIISILIAATVLMFIGLVVYLKVKNG